MKAKGVIDGLDLSASMKAKCLLLVGVLTRYQMRRKHRYNFTNLHSDRLIVLLTRDAYRGVVQELAAAGVIEVNKRYFPGVFPKSYRVLRSYLDDIEPLALDAPAHAKEVPDLSLQPALGSVALSVDGMALFDRELAKVSDPWRRACWMENVGALIGRRLWCCTDRKTGRVFTNVTSLPAILRPHLLIDGQPVAEWDIKNSQPFFLGALLADDSPERSIYIDSISNGSFYELINSHLAQPFADPGDKDRKALKELIFSKVLFGRLEHGGEVWATFKGMFPELSATIEAMKIKDGYESLAIRLQSIEAQAMIAGVMTKATNLGISVVTVHDSIVFPRQHTETIRGLIVDHCHAVVRCDPALNLKVAA